MSTPSQPTFTVRSPHFSQAPLAPGLDGLDQVSAAHRSEDFDQLVDLIVSGGLVPISPLDHVVVIEDALTAVHVRIVDGGERGREGWVPSAWLHASDNPPHLHAATAAA
jgi:hypothetical protein